MTTDRVWDEERDAPRIRAAFATLCRERTTWPSVRHLLDALPRPAPLKLISNRAHLTDAHRERVLARVQAAAAGLFVEPEREAQQAADADLSVEAICAAAFEEGRQAAMRGRGTASCPHKGNDPATARKSSAWLDGYWSVAA